jgi:hypothetical protein
MAIEVIVHLQNEDPVVADMDEMPDPTHMTITLSNPRRRDGRPLHYVTEGARLFIFPWSRVTFIEVMGDEEIEEVVEFFRE